MRKGSQEKKGPLVPVGKGVPATWALAVPLVPVGVPISLGCQTRDKRTPVYPGQQGFSNRDKLSVMEQWGWPKSLTASTCNTPLPIAMPFRPPPPLATKAPKCQPGRQNTVSSFASYTRLTGSYGAVFLTVLQQYAVQVSTQFCYLALFWTSCRSAFLRLALFCMMMTLVHHGLCAHWIWSHCTESVAKTHVQSWEFQTKKTPCLHHCTESEATPIRPAQVHTEQFFRFNSFLYHGQLLQCLQFRPLISYYCRHTE